MQIQQQMVNGHGVAHGAFVFAVADTAFACACNTPRPGHGRRRGDDHVRRARLRRRRPRGTRRGTQHVRPQRHLRRHRPPRRRRHRRVPRHQSHDRGRRRHDQARHARAGANCSTPPSGMSLDELRALQLERMRWSLRHAYEHVPHYRTAFDAAGRHARRLHRAGRHREVPVHHQGGPARQLPVRHVRRAPHRGPPHPRLQRHDRAAGGRRLHAARPRHLGRPDGPLDPRRGRAGRRHRPRRLRLRPVHRRARRALRRRTAGLHGRPGVRRHDAAPGAADPRLRTVDHHGHAVVHARAARRVRAAGLRSAQVPLADRHLRRRAVDRGDARRDRGTPRHARRRHLRTVGGDGPRRRAGVRRDQGRPAHLGGPLLPRDRRPVHRRGAARRRGGRTGLHLADQTGAADRAVPHARPDPAAARDGPSRDAADGKDHRPQRRHDHPARRERLPYPDRGGAAGRSTAWRRTSRSCSRAPAASTR